MPSGAEQAAAATRLQQAIVARVTQAVEITAERGDNQMNPGAVVEARPQLQASVAAAVAPVVQHLTNTERWWQKRSRWSMIVSFALVVAAPALRRAGLGDIDPAWQAYIIDGLTTCGNLAAGFLALRAGQALTPMFSPKPPPNPVSYRG